MRSVADSAGIPVLQGGEDVNYMGTKHYRGDPRTWHQFSLVGEDPEVCWCEVLESDLSGFEETPPCVELAAAQDPGQNKL